VQGKESRIVTWRWVEALRWLSSACFLRTCTASLELEGPFSFDLECRKALRLVERRKV
jgi:hypothetical protein